MITKFYGCNYFLSVFYIARKQKGLAHLHCGHCSFICETKNSNSPQANSGTTFKLINKNTNTFRIHISGENDQNPTFCYVLTWLFRDQYFLLYKTNFLIQSIFKTNIE